MNEVTHVTIKVLQVIVISKVTLAELPTESVAITVTECTPHAGILAVARTRTYRSQGSTNFVREANFAEQGSSRYKTMREAMRNRIVHACCSYYQYFVISLEGATLRNRVVHAVKQ